MPVLSAADLEFFAEHGWVVAKGVIDPAQAARTALEVWEFAGLDPGDADSWYLEADGVTPRPINTLHYHGQAEWENRTAPRVHEAFAQIWGSARLWTSHDSVNLNLPTRDAASPEHRMHWDCDMRLWSLSEAKAARPIVGGVQGVLCECTNRYTRALRRRSAALLLSPLSPLIVAFLCRPRRHPTRERCLRMPRWLPPPVGCVARHATGGHREYYRCDERRIPGPGLPSRRVGRRSRHLCAVRRAPFIPSPACLPPSLSLSYPHARLGPVATYTSE
jgi:hypothetical protein